MLTTLKKFARLGAVAPRALVLPIVGDGSFDFSTVTSADVFVRRPSGEEFQIVGVPITGQTSAGLTLTHPWAAGELNQPGPWACYARLYVSGGQIDTDPESFEVLGPYEPVVRSAPP